MRDVASAASTTTTWIETSFFLLRGVYFHCHPNPWGDGGKFIPRLMILPFQLSFSCALAGDLRDVRFAYIYIYRMYLNMPFIHRHPTHRWYLRRYHTYRHCIQRNTNYLLPGTECTDIIPVPSYLCAIPALMFCLYKWCNVCIVYPFYGTFFSCLRRTFSR
jgi:hypothetical protein